MPKSLFWRLAMLLMAALAIAVLAMIFLFRQDRATLIARNFTEAKMAQVEALRTTLANLTPEERGSRPMMALQKIGREYGALLVPVDRRPEIGQIPRGPALQPLVEKLQEQLGRDTEVRLGMRMDQPIVWIRLSVGGDANRGVWAGFPIRNVESGEVPMRLLGMLAVILAALLAGTFWFARRLSRPLADLADAVDKVAVGKRPDPLPEDGPTEIARVAHNVNRMAANLERLEKNRSTMLAGISHAMHHDTLLYWGCFSPEQHGPALRGYVYDEAGRCLALGVFESCKKADSLATSRSARFGKVWHSQTMRTFQPERLKARRVCRSRAALRRSFASQ